MQFASANLAADSSSLSVDMCQTTNYVNVQVHKYNRLTEEKRNTGQTVRLQFDCIKEREREVNV